MDIQVPTVTKIVEWDSEDKWFSWFAMGPLEFFTMISKDKETEEKLKTLWCGGLFPELSKAYSSLKAVRKYKKERELVELHRNCDAVIDHWWIAYKEFLQELSKVIGYNIGFLYTDDRKFKSKGKESINKNP